MLHGYIPRFNDRILRKVADVGAEEWRDPMKIEDQACKEIESRQQKVKNNYDKERCRTISHEPGEIVIVRRLPKHTGEPAKIQPKHRGPLIVVDVLPNNIYRVTQLEEKQKGSFYHSSCQSA